MFGEMLEEKCNDFFFQRNSRNFIFNPFYKDGDKKY